LISLLFAGFGYFLLLSLADHSPIRETWALRGVDATLALVGGAFLFFALKEASTKLRPWTSLRIAPKGVHLVQSGVFRPLNLAWKLEDVVDVRAAELRPGSYSLQFLFREGAPLWVVENQKATDVSWAVEFVRTALIVSASQKRAAPPQL
jgi:hypothetical protein